jgi:hypothetical protein
MEYDNPQFATAVKKVLQGTVAHITDSIENLKDAVSAHWQADEKRYETKPVSVTNLRTDVPIPIENKTKKSVYEWIWIIFKGTLEIFGIAAVIVYTCVSYLQWRDAGENFRIEQRAWVGFESVQGPKNLPNGQLGFGVNFRNSGRTPAKYVTTELMPPIIRKAEEPEPECVDTIASKDVPQGLLQPNAAINQHLEISPENWKAAINGDAKIYLSGRFAYYDTFGHFHSTGYCYSLEPFQNGNSNATGACHNKCNKPDEDNE